MSHPLTRLLQSQHRGVSSGRPRRAQYCCCGASSFLHPLGRLDCNIRVICLRCECMSSVLSDSANQRSTEFNHPQAFHSNLSTALQVVKSQMVQIVRTITHLPSPTSLSLRLQNLGHEIVRRLATHDRAPSQKYARLSAISSLPEFTSSKITRDLHILPASQSPEQSRVHYCTIRGQ